MKKYLYWIPAQDFSDVKAACKTLDMRLTGSMMTPCETLRATPDKAVYATPQVFNRVCKRQGSWYRASDRKGKYLLVTAKKLPAAFGAYLDAEMSESAFQPDTVPSTSDLLAVVNSAEYNSQKPEAWEQKTLLDAVMFKVLFTLNRYWGWGDNLHSKWLTHRANHANFVANHVHTEIDGEKVPYSVSDNAGICSSCVEFFNISNKDQRELVRACPGSITFGGAKPDVFLDIQPVR